MKKKRNRDNITFILLITVLIGVLFISILKLLPDISSANQSNMERKRIEEIVTENSDENASSNESDTVVFTHDAFKALHEINSDLVGYLEFDSGIVSGPVVKGYTNDSYLRTSFEKKYSSQGVLFMDSGATLNSQHFTIFGHNVYYDDNAMFSPVSKLVSQEEYEKSKTFNIYTSEEKRQYEITNVMYFHESEFIDYNYMQTTFNTPEAFNSWMGYISNRNLIHADKFITFQDNFVTLQTCKRWDDQTIILVLAKEISRFPY